MLGFCLILQGKFSSSQAEYSIEDWMLDLLTNEGEGTGRWRGWMDGGMDIRDDGWGREAAENKGELTQHWEKEAGTYPSHPSAHSSLGALHLSGVTLTFSC